MRALVSVAASAVLMIIGGSAGATDPASAPPEALRCQSLIEAFDQALPSHRGTPRLTDARRLRVQGAAECRKGAYRSGCRMLERGLRHLGTSGPPASTPSLATRS